MHLLLKHKGGGEIGEDKSKFLIWWQQTKEFIILVDYIACSLGDVRQVEKSLRRVYKLRNTFYGESGFFKFTWKKICTSCSPVLSWQWRSHEEEIRDECKQDGTETWRRLNTVQGFRSHLAKETKVNVRGTDLKNQWGTGDWRWRSWQFPWATLQGKTIWDTWQYSSVQFSSVAQSRPTLWPREPQHTRPPCQSPTPGVYPNPCPLSQWCPPTISSSVIPFSSCLQSFPASGSSQWVSSSHQVAKVLEFQLQHHSFQWTPKTDLLRDWLVGSPCSPRDSQESFPTPQFKSINSSALSFLYRCWERASEGRQTETTITDN